MPPLRGHCTPPEHLANEFSARTNLAQLLLPDASYWPVKPVPAVRLDRDGNHELVECAWGLLPLWIEAEERNRQARSFLRRLLQREKERTDTQPGRPVAEAFPQQRGLVTINQFDRNPDGAC